MRQAFGLSTILLFTLPLVACNADEVSRVKPILAIEDVTVDPSGAADYVLDFGQVLVGRTQRDRVTLVNVGAARLTVDAVTATAPFEASLATRELNANARTPLEFAFTPTGEAAFEQRVTVTSNGGTATIRLVGLGVPVEPCRLVANPLSVDFGTVPVGAHLQKAVVLTNEGGDTCHVTKVALATGSATAYAILTSGGARTFELAPAAWTEVIVRFRPTAGGPQLATVEVTIGDASTLPIQLSGNGLADPVEPCRLVASPPSVDFGTVLTGSTAEQAIVLRNEGGDACRGMQLAVAEDSATAYSFETSEGDNTTFELAPSATKEVLVRFKPTTAGGPQLGTVEVTTEDASTLLLELTGNGEEPEEPEEPCPGALPDGTCPVAADPVYVNTSDQLFSYDPTNGVATLVGTFKAGSATIDGMTDIAIDTKGAMLGVRSKGTGSSRVMELYWINPASAEVAKLANLGGGITGTLNGLTFLADGRLILAGEAVWAIDRSTGAVVSTLVPRGTYETSGDIIGLPDGYLYWSVRGSSGGNDRLVRINPADGGTRVVGTTSKTGIYGLGYGNGTLYGFSSDKTSFVISPDTAATSQTRTTDGSWWGATTNPVLW